MQLKGILTSQHHLLNFLIRKLSAKLNNKYGNVQSSPVELTFQTCSAGFVYMIMSEHNINKDQIAVIQISSSAVVHVFVETVESTYVGVWDTKFYANKLQLTCVHNGGQDISS